MFPIQFSFDEDNTYEVFDGDLLNDDVQGIFYICVYKHYEDLKI